MIVSYETAKLVKEKGYEQDIYPCYADDGMIHTWAYFTITNPDSGMYYAPLQCELQKWLRDMGMYVLLEETETYSLRTGIGFYYKIIKVKDKEHLRLDCSMYFYKTYEEALEAGLKEGLRLI